MNRLLSSYWLARELEAVRKLHLEGPENMRLGDAPIPRIVALAMRALEDHPELIDGTQTATAA